METGTVSIERNVREAARREREPLLQFIGSAFTAWLGKSAEAWTRLGDEAESPYPGATAPSESEILEIRQRIDYMRAKMDRFGYAAKARTGQERGRFDREG
ncbi:MAG: hypothetical protein K0Q94_3768 [Paenibacillus sp.]|jgi:hypothetical protein|nr:hypothetical protein [Paenibacillus sp.]